MQGSVRRAISFTPIQGTSSYSILLTPSRPNPYLPSSRRKRSDAQKKQQPKNAEDTTGPSSLSDHWTNPNNLTNQPQWPLMIDSTTTKEWAASSEQVLRIIFRDVFMAYSEMKHVMTPLILVETIVSNLDALLHKLSGYIQDPLLSVFEKIPLKELRESLQFERDTWYLIRICFGPPSALPSELFSRVTCPARTPQESFLNGAGHIKIRRILQWLESSFYGHNFKSQDSFYMQRGQHNILEDRSCDTDDIENPTSVLATSLNSITPHHDPAYLWAYSSIRNSGVPVKLDIDFPLRKGNPPLENIDDHAEERISKCVFWLLRAGCDQEARLLTKEVKQHWRNALWASGALDVDAIGRDGVVGMSRSIWRTMARKIVTTVTKMDQEDQSWDTSRLPKFEAALYGLFSGLVDPVLSISNTYEDRLWARLMNLLDSSVEKYIQISPSNPVESIAPDPYDYDDQEILETFNKCEIGESESSFTPGIRRIRSFFSLGPTCVPQYSLELLKQIHSMVTKSAAPDRILRSMAHFAIFLHISDCIAQPEELDLYQKILEIYSRRLVELVKTEEDSVLKSKNFDPPRPQSYDLTARYCAYLTNELLIDIYSDLLHNSLISDLRMEELYDSDDFSLAKDCRTICLEKAGECFENRGRQVLTSLIVKTVDKVWKKSLVSAEAENGTPTRNEITINDIRSIRVIELLVFPAYPNYTEALVRACTLTRRFVTVGKMMAAREIYSFFPREVLQYINSPAYINPRHEFDCWDAYFSSVASHNDWSNYKLKELPIPPSKEIERDSMGGVEVSYEAQTYATLKMATYKEELEEYSRVLSGLAEKAVRDLKGALLFCGGWLCDLDENDVKMNDKRSLERKKELLLCRAICVPTMVTLLHDILHSSARYHEAVELSNIVADDRYSLNECFGREQLSSFLVKIGESVAMMAQAEIDENEANTFYEGTIFEKFDS